MSRQRGSRVSRLSWVRFFPEDFLGGTQQMDCRQVGQYILALCAQWGAERGAERTGLRTGNGALKAVLRGEDMDPEVRCKFEEVILPSGTFLRNTRMSLEIAGSVAEWEARVRGAERTAERAAEHGAERSAERTQSTTTTTNGQRKSGTQAAPAPWSREAADDFKAVYGGNPPAQFFPHVAAVVKKHAWETVRPVLRAVLEETPLEYLNLPKVLGVRVEAAAAGIIAKPPRKGGKTIESPVDSYDAVYEAIKRGELSDGQERAETVRVHLAPGHGSEGAGGSGAGVLSGARGSDRRGGNYGGGDRGAYGAILPGAGRDP